MSDFRNITAGYCSGMGRIRKNNEDSWYADGDYSRLETMDQ